MLKKIIVPSFIALLLGIGSFGVLSMASVQAQDVKDNLCGGADLSLSKGDCSKNPCVERAADGTCKKHDDKSAETKLNSLITSIVNIFSVVVGIVAVIMIIFSGFKYITSGGDSGKISSAKTTIIYAIVGLIIVALAQAIVRFILAKVG